MRVMDDTQESIDGNRVMSYNYWFTGPWDK